ncbi:17-beta-hydroxysteroid dehydrogenase type 6-like [Numida meleagris]|uniref:17-beta-hydroxysteroid dehydrogenase type 6-like n=1 Tax=Numida meleagris TaxID=8996 RepID=UPI000B3D820F|nr:17-beta-hydroxysteroid dehydrogenase type 6-like [Numida meleagris]
MWLWLLVLLGLWLLRRWHRGRQTVPGLDEKFVLITGCDSGFGNVLARQASVRASPLPCSAGSRLGAAVMALSPFRREMRPFGVKVSIIEPGGFRTGMTDPKATLKELERIWARLPTETRVSYGRRYLEIYANRNALLHRLSSPRLSRVTARMQHALLSRSPRSRYAAGWDALLFLLPLSYCPAWFCDAIVALAMPKPEYGAPAPP